MKKRTRRVLALIILVSITSGLEPLQKLLFAGPCLVALLIEWDEFQPEKEWSKGWVER